MFLGDNGTDRDVVSLHTSGQIPGRKGHTVKHGTHVPFIAQGAGIKPTTYDGLGDLTDILPTLLDYAGATMPSDLDGHSLKGVFSGDSDPVREWIYCYYHPNWGTFKHTEYAFDKDFKLYSDGRLYHYQDDLEEANPLDPEEMEYSEVRQKLQKVLNSMK